MPFFPSFSRAIRLSFTYCYDDADAHAHRGIVYMLFITFAAALRAERRAILEICRLLPCCRLSIRHCFMRARLRALLPRALVACAFMPLLIIEH